MHGLPGFFDLAGNVCIWMLAKGFRVVTVGEVVDVVLRGREEGGEGEGGSERERERE